MNFCWCTITVDNMEESVQFYQDILGLPISRRFMGGPGVEIVFFCDGETKIELIHDASHKAPGRIDGISLGLGVKSMDETMKVLKEKGIAIESGPYQPNPHVKYFYIRDPSGVQVQIVENM